MLPSASLSLELWVLFFDCSSPFFSCPGTSHGQSNRVIKPDFRLMFDLVSFTPSSTRTRIYDRLDDYLFSIYSRSSHHIQHRPTSKAVASELIFVLRLTYSTPNQ